MAGNINRLDASSDVVHVVLVCSPQPDKREEVSNLHEEKKTAHPLTKTKNKRALLTLCETSTQVEAMIRDGVKVHEENPSCLAWHVSKTIEQDGGESKIILVQT